MKAQKTAGRMPLGIAAGVLMLGLVNGGLQRSAAAEQTDIAAITVDTLIAEDDGSFTAAVHLDRLPESGLSALDFAIAYDPAVLSISQVELLYDTGADAAEAAVNPELAGTVFHYEDTGSEIQIRWATALLNRDYWLTEERVLFTISGTVLADAEPGSHSALTIAPATRETSKGSGVMNTEIFAGYVDEERNTRLCETVLKNGHVFTLRDETGATVYGDLNMSGEPDMADAVLLNRLIAEDEGLVLDCAAAYANADCEFDGVLTIADVTLMLRVLDGLDEAAVLGAREENSPTGNV